MRARPDDDPFWIRIGNVLSFLCYLAALFIAIIAAIGVTFTAQLWIVLALIAAGLALNTSAPFPINKG